MRFKTDENLHPSIAEFLGQQSHDVLTVWDENLRGCRDERIAEVCRAEGRALLTLDVDFADIRNYPPDKHPGIVVLRLARQDRTFVLGVVQRIAPLFKTETVEGRLWIVDETKVRVRGGDS